MKIIPRGPVVINGLMHASADFVYTREEFIAAISQHFVGPEPPAVARLKELIDQDVLNSASDAGEANQNAKCASHESGTGTAR